ncbi:MAG: hypothetical protein ACM3MA_00195 [Acidobacteriota bacterium]
MQRTTAEPTPTAPAAKATTVTEREKRPLARFLIPGVVVVLLLLAAGAYWWFTNKMGVPSYIDKSKYQAVFLQNGEFYFGKVQAADETTVRLVDVWYVQKAAAAEEEATTNLELIKLGSEVHGPEDIWPSTVVKCCISKISNLTLMSSRRLKKRRNNKADASCSKYEAINNCPVRLGSGENSSSER